MPEIELKVGAKVDLLNREELEAENTKLADKLTAALAVRRPQNIIAQGMVTLDASGNGVIIFDPPGPSLGMAWDVRRVNVTAQDPATVTAGTAYVYRGSDPLVLSPYNFVDKGAIPNVGTWSQHQFSLRNGEQVYVRIKGGPVGGTIFAAIQALAEPQRIAFGVAAI